MASAIVTATKKPTARQIEAAAALYRTNTLAVADKFRKLTEQSESDLRRDLLKAGLGRVSGEAISAYLQKQRKKAPPSAEEAAKREKEKREMGGLYLSTVGQRIDDLGAFAEAIENEKLDDLGQVAAGRFMFLACTQAAKELERAAELLGVKCPGTLMSTMGDM